VVVRWPLSSLSFSLTHSPSLSLHLSFILPPSSSSFFPKMPPAIPWVSAPQFTFSLSSSSNSPSVFSVGIEDFGSGAGEAGAERDDS